MTDEIFNACVRFLEWLADRLGTTYQAVNVWIFVIIWPILTAAMAACIVIQRFQIRKLTRRPKNKQDASGKAGRI